MSNNFEIEQQIEQKLSITPKMIQRISILSSTSAELGEMITNELENNPALEEKSPESEEFKTENYENEYKENYREKIISKKINFHEFLENQVGELKVSSKQKILLKELIHNINQNGYFPSDFNLKEIAEEKKISTEILAEGIKILQNLEPSGIAARNITECLNIQIEHLQDNMYPKKTIQIAKKLINPAEDFVEYEEELKIPDILVSIKNEKMNVQLNEEKFKTDGIKPLVCNQEYVEISKELGKLDRKDQKHIKEKLGQAKDFIESVRNWKETLLRVGTVIAKNQNNFFKNGIQEIKPLKLVNI